MVRTDWTIDEVVLPEDINEIGRGINENRQDIEKHSSNKNNPHGVTKVQIGLGNVDNVKQMPLRETRVSDINLDDYKSPGIYAIGERNENSPSNFSTLIVFTSYADRITQMLTSASNSKIYFRFWRTNVWSEWIETETTEGAQSKVNAHANNKSNPHGVTKAQVGLGSVDNVQQATKSEFKTHVADTVRHITANERNTWNAKETPVGAQEKADKALLEAKKYMGLNAQMHKVTDDNGQALMISEGSDLNNITKTGFYRGRNLINQPSKNFTWFYYTVLQQNAFECVQYATAFSKRAETYIRRSDVSGEFSAWQLFSASDLEWTTVPTLLNGWKTFSRPVQYIQIGNMVHFRGAVTDGLYFEPIFYMPTNLRPKQVYAIPCASIGTGSSNYPANRLQIETTGAVMIRFDGSVPSYSLDGACYAIN